MRDKGIFATTLYSLLHDRRPCNKCVEPVYGAFKCV